MQFSWAACECSHHAILDRVIDVMIVHGISLSVPLIPPRILGSEAEPAAIIGSGYFR
jgi:hypothetical protein